jgi:hypothetical protein
MGKPNFQKQSNPFLGADTNGQCPICCVPMGASIDDGGHKYQDGEPMLATSGPTLCSNGHVWEWVVELKYLGKTLTEFKKETF